MSARLRTIYAFLITALCVGSSAHAQLEYPQPLTVDVPSATVSGAFLIDGAPAPSDFGEQGFVHLIGSGTPTPITLGVTNTQAYGPVMLIEGDYRPAYELLFSDGALPKNPLATIGAAVFVTDSAVVDVDIPTVDVAFTFTLNGVPAPALPGQAGSIWLRDAETGDEMWVASTHVGAETIKVLPGIYDVVYRHQAGSTVPQNENAVVQADVPLFSDQNVLVDLPTRDQTLSFLLNGAPFPTSSYTEAEIELRNRLTGDAVSFGPTTAGSATRTVLPGVYDVAYSKIDVSDLIPANVDATVAVGIALDSGGGGFPLSGSIDVPAATITLDATLNGAPGFPTSIYERGQIVLVGSHGNEVLLGTTDEGTPAPVMVVQGKYEAHYRHLEGTTIVPRNPDVRVASGITVVSDTTLQVDVPAITVTPAFTLDGAAFSTSQYERGDLRLRDSQTGTQIPLGSSHEVPDPVVIVPGEYDVEWDWQEGTTIVPRNLDHVLTRRVQLESTQGLSIDVPTRIVAPTFSLDGVAFPTDAAQSGRFVLRPILGGGGVDIGSTSQSTPETVRVIRDVYAVEYNWVAGTAVPRNRNHPVGFANVPEPGLGAGLAAGAGVLVRLDRVRRRRVARTPRRSEAV